MMSKTNWKARERQAASMIGKNGKRYKANVGGFIDCESDTCVAQVKERKTLSLAALEKLAVEIERVGAQKIKPGIVMVKRSAGRGVSTPWLIVMTAGVFRDFNGDAALPTDSPPPSGRSTLPVAP